MKTIEQQLSELQKTFPKAHIRYNAETDEYFISFFSREYYCSLMIG